MDVNGYEIFITDQELPHLSSAWTNINANDKSFKFERSTDRTKVFSISGYIQKDTEELTRAEAKGLNDSLNTTPSGTLRDGYGYTYSVLVESFSIKPVPGAPRKWTFSMSFRMLS